ncbi:hypothetical protein MARCHEWKA_03650 [Brevundimonas phage vB_BpoS-Marchewka]|uniref:Uncharacterized protein n=1 Tax=Brevundimonas phage vB_BpoS-Marchewka TaxID=2948604 RepID=A0A9E7N5E8_9CAUD|nr:hypothetical protein MARCHEWKA_03650 [Brevundimonas phage vB_BpoS-Marchewka]UTC29323.1 hypothetical protein BAMBUS_02410 [Brevundimonas phage vB_BpoS-Bambus]
MRQFHAHCARWLTRLGHDAGDAEAVAWTIVEHASDATRLRQQPYCVIRPGTDEAPVFLSGINSDRLRVHTGVLIVLDVAAMKGGV